MKLIIMKTDGACQWPTDTTQKSVIPFDAIFKFGEHT